MSDMYAIKASTLTALGDAVREKMNMTPFSDLFYLNITSNSYNTTTLSKTFKNKFVISLIDGLWDNYDAIGFYSDVNKPSNNKILYDNIKNLQFPLEIVAECQQLVIKADLGRNTSFINLEVLTIPLDDNGECKYTPLEMVEQINSMMLGPTEEELTFSGKLNYAFAFGKWDWVIEKYGNKITTKNVKGLNYCFHQSYADILFELNMDETSSYHDISATFSFYYGKTVPVIHKAKPDKLDQLFYEAASIVHVPEDFCDDWDWSYLDNTTGSYSGSCHSIFSGCYSLRSFPMKLFYHGNKEVGSSGVSTKYAFNNCAKLDEVIDFPWIYTATYDKTGYNGIFYNTFDYCHRLKNFTFAPMEVAPKWANQVIDLSKQAGWGTAAQTNYDKTKEIKDDATYQALKDDPDCWTNNVAYSRYNKESAVRTLNSLPDTTATGSNTIKFKGEAGSLTDGGAINTLTEEEIAVAAAKGWTVSFV